MKMQPVGLWKTTELYRNSEGKGIGREGTHHDVNERKGCMKAPLSLITGPNKAVLLDVLFIAKNPKRTYSPTYPAKNTVIPFFPSQGKTKSKKWARLSVKIINHSKS